MKLMGKGFWWLQLLLGVAAVGLGIAALVWPAATVRVVGTIFGLNLLLAGIFHTATALLRVRESPMYRVFGTVIGVLLAVIGLVCLRDVMRSAVLLALVVSIGWLLDGVTEIVLGLSSPHDPRRGWRIVAGGGYVLAALVVFVWPALSLATFLSVGAIILIVYGIAHVAAAVSMAGVPHRADIPAAVPPLHRL
jgi:uncharacterized membrane protein HdeD (DUF308 family)